MVYRLQFVGMRPRVLDTVSNYKYQFNKKQRREPPMIDTFGRRFANHVMDVKSIY